MIILKVTKIRVYGLPRKQILEKSQEGDGEGRQTEAKLMVKL